MNVVRKMKGKGGMEEIEMGVKGIFRGRWGNGFTLERLERKCVCYVFGVGVKWGCRSIGPVPSKKKKILVRKKKSFRPFIQPKGCSAKGIIRGNVILKIVWKCYLKNYVFYFLKVKKMLFSIQNLTFLSTFSSLTRAQEHSLTLF